LTFFVRRIFAALVFGAQLCSARTVIKDATTHAQAASPSDRVTVRMMSSPTCRRAQSASEFSGL
jgi:hypothetical protein